eukprot:6173386-Pleurochrysis_carterae.AAC.1
MTHVHTITSRYQTLSYQLYDCARTSFALLIEKPDVLSFLLDRHRPRSRSLIPHVSQCPGYRALRGDTLRLARLHAQLARGCERDGEGDGSVGRVLHRVARQVDQHHEKPPT